MKWYNNALLLCLFGVSLVAAYEFKDSDYNEYLMQDLIEISEDVGNDELQTFRFKRDTAAVATDSSITLASNDGNKDDDKKCKSNKKSHGGYKCCNDANSDALHDKFKELKKQCLAEIRGPKKDEESSFDMFSCEKVNKTKEEYLCVSECVGKKINILDKEGNLIDAAAIAHVKNDISMAVWQKDVAESVAAKCLAEAKEVTTVKRETITTDEKKCSGASMKFGHCIWREFTKSCPKELQTDTKKCASLREKLERGEKIDFHMYHHGKSHHGRGVESSEERK